MRWHQLVVFNINITMLIVIIHIKDGYLQHAVAPAGDPAAAPLGGCGGRQEEAQQR